MKVVGWSFEVALWLWGPVKVFGLLGEAVGEWSVWVESVGWARRLVGVLVVHLVWLRVWCVLRWAAVVG